MVQFDKWHGFETVTYSFTCETDEMATNDIKIGFVAVTAMRTITTTIEKMNTKRDIDKSLLFNTQVTDFEVQTRDIATPPLAAYPNLPPLPPKGALVIVDIITLHSLQK